MEADSTSDGTVPQQVIFYISVFKRYYDLLMFADLMFVSGCLKMLSSFLEDLGGFL